LIIQRKDKHYRKKPKIITIDRTSISCIRGSIDLKLKMAMLFAAIALIVGLAAAVELLGTWQEEGSAAEGQPSSESPDFSQFYSMVPGGPGEGPEQASPPSQQPTTLYVGGPDQQAVGYSQLQSYSAFTGGNTLWIEGTSSWTQYVQVPQGARLSLVPMTSAGGPGYLFEIYPSGRLQRDYHYFSPNSRISFTADELGQHILLFTANDLASNAVIIDVKRYVPGPVPTPGPSFGSAQMQIISSSLKGYDVYVDGRFQLTEGRGGIPDGSCSFPVAGNAIHTIEIRKGGSYTSQTRYFQAGGTYTLRIN
jgi:hypothetical protein